jgi:G3E family GTPase
MMNEISNHDNKNRQFSLIGGFLGAGKTTLIGKYAQWLQEQGLQVALVTNDQGEGLLDTASAQEALGRESEETAGLDGETGRKEPIESEGVESSVRIDRPARRAEDSRSVDSRVAEITGGCFCCRLDELVGTIQQLDEEGRPDVLIAEPVGSCTDLMATVVRPLEQVYETPFALSPLAVVLDARRALASLGGKRSKRDFHRDVGYIYRKQLEEAEWLVVNKCDLLTKEDLADLLQRLEKDYPGKRVFVVSAKTGEGLEHWFEALRSHETSGGSEVEVDYKRYAEGEALLGWVNSEATCQAKHDLDCEPWLQSLGQRIGHLLDEGGYEVGHFKMSVTANGHRYRVHQVMGGEEVESRSTGVPPVKGSTSEITESLETGETNEALGFTGETPVLLVNLRAEGDAKALEKLVVQAITEQNEVDVTFAQQAAFQPGEPVPVHRIAAA